MNDAGIRISEKGQPILTKGRRQGSGLKRESIFIIALLALCLILFFFLLGDRPLWDIDEGMHAATAKEMVLSGDWITPRLNGVEFYDKPVLFTWLVAVSFLVFGFTEFAARLPAAVLGSGCVFATYLLGRYMFGRTVGFLGGVILATSLEFVILSRVVVHDIALAFFVTLTLLCFFAGFSVEKHRRTYFLLAYASAGLAVLSKGPIGVLLPALIVGSFMLFERKLSCLRDMEIGWGLVLFLVITAPWYILISLKNKDYAAYFFIQQNLGSFLSQDVRHTKPFYYYFLVLMGGFLPWSFFLPGAIIHGLREGPRHLSRETVFLVIWFGLVFVFFSAASSKLGTYILPLFPPASLLVAVLWRDVMKAPTTTLRRSLLWPMVVLLVIPPLGLLYMRLFPPTDLSSEFGIDLVRLNHLGLLCTASAILAFLFFSRHRYTACFSTLVGVVISGIMIFMMLVVPSIDPYRSTKRLAERLDRMIPPGAELVFFRKLKDSALFYTNRRAIVLRDPQELTDRIAGDRPFFFIAERRDFEKLKNPKQMTHVVGQEGTKLLISNRPPP